MAMIAGIAYCMSNRPTGFSPNSLKFFVDIGKNAYFQRKGKNSKSKTTGLILNCFYF
jgi:hypothetical protein